MVSHCANPACAAPGYTCETEDYFNLRCGLSVFRVSPSLEKH